MIPGKVDFDGSGCLSILGEVEVLSSDNSGNTNRVDGADDIDEVDDVDGTDDGGTSDFED